MSVWHAIDAVIMVEFDVKSVLVKDPRSTTVCFTVKGEAIAQPRHRLHQLISSGSRFGQEEEVESID